jgi:PrgI family protein
MASYQIPQFLDSGDKIIGPLNVRQFGYALAGSFISIGIYSVISSIIPGIGLIAFVPAIPFIALFGYLAFGSFNGRDSEVYVFKLFLYSSKPRTMIYTRVPEISDLETRLLLNTASEIQKNWSERATKQKVDSTNSYATFEQETAQTKAEKIRQLGLNLDIGQRNAQQTIIRSEVSRQISEEQIRALQPKKSGSYTQSILINKQSNIEPIETPQSLDTNTNYFN